MTWPGGCPPRAPGCAPPPRSTPLPRPPSPTPARPAGSASPSPARPGSRSGRTGPAAGPATTYRRIEKQSFAVTCDIDHDQVSYDAASDGCWPLITNDRDMTTACVLAAYRYQPNLERRHHLLKGVQDAAPVWIKTIPRIEAIFLCHFIALLISALIERQIRMAMKAAEIARIPIYPELRGCAAPTADRIFEVFAHVSRHELRDTARNLIQVFEPELTELQLKILDLLGIPATIYSRVAEPPPAAG